MMQRNQVHLVLFMVPLTYDPEMSILGLVTSKPCTLPSIGTEKPSAGLPVTDQWKTSYLPHDYNTYVMYMYSIYIMCDPRMETAIDKKHMDKSKGADEYQKQKGG